MSVQQDGTGLLDSEIQPFELGFFAAIHDDISLIFPQATHEVQGQIISMVPMRDGIRLETQVILPKGGSSWPCLMIRTPYAQAMGYWQAIYANFVKHGYAVVLQQVRGRGNSEGKWMPFMNEREDGIDTLNWLVQQPWQNGNIGLMGTSYHGYVQWAVADVLPSQVKALFIDMFSTDRFHRLYMNGMFRMDAYTSWAFANTDIDKDLPFDELYKESLLMMPHNETDYKLLGERLPVYQSMIASTREQDDYWQTGVWKQLTEIPAKIKVPICFTGGWFDQNLSGMLKQYCELPLETQKKSIFAIGPFEHTGSADGPLEYPDAGKYGHTFLKLALDWFEYQLKPSTSPDKLYFGIEAYVIGAGEWIKYPTWPIPSHDRTFYLAEGFSLKSSSDDAGEYSYTYDPANPISTNGGSALLAHAMFPDQGYPSGCQLQETYDDRDDILIFRSETFKEKMRFAGPIRAILHVSSTAEDTAFSVKVCEEHADGKAYNIADGITTLCNQDRLPSLIDYQPGSKVEVEIAMWDTAWEIQTGSRLRIDISSSNFPAFNQHANKKGIWSAIDSNITARQIVYYGNDESRILFPVLK